MSQQGCSPQINLFRKELPGPRIAVISDIHSNLVALEPVLEKINDESVDAIIVAGDHVGYYTQINETLEKLEKTSYVSIMGNHDFAAVETCPLTRARLNPFAQVAIEYTRLHISSKSHAWLVKLPLRAILKYEDLKILMVHGHPEKPFEYLIGYNEERTLEMIRDVLEKIDTDILITGHTHIPRVVSNKNKYYINPGSVGQPRDRDNRASFAIMDLDKKEFQIHRIDYDIDQVKRLVQEALLPKELWERLYEGR